MRVIKFRAYHPTSGFVTFFLHDLFDSLIRFDDGDEYHIGSPEIELTQFIGLQDKNGRELCEGDIVKHTRPDGIYVVAWIDGAVSFALRKPGHTMWLGELCQPLCEIIGNIFENDDLLKQ